eukprot:scaffold17889_cov15-Prasinocladus_malaysianus.AAC.1
MGVAAECRDATSLLDSLSNHSVNHFDSCVMSADVPTSVGTAAHPPRCVRMNLVVRRVGKHLRVQSEKLPISRCIVVPTSKRQEEAESAPQVCCIEKRPDTLTHSGMRRFAYEMYTH